MSLRNKIANSIRTSLHWDLRNSIFQLENRIEELHNENLLLRKAIADPAGVGLLRLRLRNLNVLPKYELVFYQMPANAVCVDCGANEGMFTDVILSLNGICHSFEPNPVLCSLMKRKYRGIEGVTLNQAAVSDHQGTAMFRLPEKINDNFLVYSDGGSIVEDVQNTLQGRGDMTNSGYSVEVVRLVDYLRHLLEKEKEIYILKLDVEGAEFDILPDLIASECCSKIRYIFCETHERCFQDGQEKINHIKDLIQQKNITNIYLDWA